MPHDPLTSGNNNLCVSSGCSHLQSQLIHILIIISTSFASLASSCCLLCAHIDVHNPRIPLNRGASRTSNYAEVLGEKKNNSTRLGSKHPPPLWNSWGVVCLCVLWLRWCVGVCVCWHLRSLLAQAGKSDLFYVHYVHAAESVGLHWRWMQPLRIFQQIPEGACRVKTMP